MNIFPENIASSALVLLQFASILQENSPFGREIKANGNLNDTSKTLAEIIFSINIKQSVCLDTIVKQNYTCNFIENLQIIEHY